MIGFLNDGLGGAQCVAKDEIRQIGVLERHCAQQREPFPPHEFARTSGCCLRLLVLASRDLSSCVHIQRVQQERSERQSWAPREV